MVECFCFPSRILILTLLLDFIPFPSKILFEFSLFLIVYYHGCVLFCLLFSILKLYSSKKQKRSVAIEKKRKKKTNKQSSQRKKEKKRKEVGDVLGQ